jgi:hypothetical protein
MFRQLSMFVAVSLLMCAASGRAEERKSDFAATVQLLAGENYHYKIDFLFLTGLAVGQLRMTGTDRQGVYRAQLTGHTVGIVSWLIGERVQTYTSIMESNPDGSLRSLEHVARIEKRRWGPWQSWVRRFRYEYLQGKISEEKIHNGVSLAKIDHKIPKGQQPVDMLTAFYNLRAGVYGPLDRGAHLVIPTCSGGRFTKMDVNVQTVSEQQARKSFPADGLLVEIKLDPEIFDIGNGIMYVWFDNSGVPRRGTLQDLVGLGDARGYMDKESL